MITAPANPQATLVMASHIAFEVTLREALKGRGEGPWLERLRAAIHEKVSSLVVVGPSPSVAAAQIEEAIAWIDDAFDAALDAT